MIYVCDECRMVRDCSCQTKKISTRICHYCGVVGLTRMCDCWAVGFRVKQPGSRPNKVIEKCERCLFIGGCECDAVFTRLGRCPECQEDRLLKKCECNSMVIV